MKCPGCGNPRDEAWPESPEASVGLIGKYRARVLKCMACAEMSHKQEQYQRAKGDRHGTYWFVEDLDQVEED